MNSPRTLIIVLLALGMGALLEPSSQGATPLPFALPQLVNTDGHADDLAVGDFDGDGIPDVAVLTLQTGVVVYFGDGNGGYRSATATISFLNAVIGGMAAADLDGSGHSTLLLVPETSAVYLYTWQDDGTNTHTGTFTSTSIDLSTANPNLNAGKVAVGDLTAAGSRDIVVSDDFGSEGIIWIPNHGDGNFGTPVKYAASGVVYGGKLVLKDLNGDGFDDVILGRYDKIGVLLNNGDGTLAANTTYLATNLTYGGSALAGFSIQSATVADVDHDGFPDLVATGYVNDPVTHVSTYYLSVNLNDGHGGFGAGVAYRFALNGGQRIYADAIVAADLDGDGRDEVVTPGFDPSGSGFTGAIVTRWSGTGASLAVASQDQYAASHTVTYGALVAADADGDGAIDLLLGTSSSIFDTSTAHSLFAVFQNQTPFLPPPPPGRVVQFGTVNPNVGEGDDLKIPVLRGTASTGQVVVYFQFGGSAQQGYGTLTRNADYVLVDPPAGVGLTFAEGEHVKFLQIHTLKSAASKRENTVELTINTPLGDADVGDPAQLSFNIIDGNPALLAKAGALAVTVASPVKPVPAALGIPATIKNVARTGADWTYSVIQALPPNAAHASVELQVSILPPAQKLWTDFLPLTQGKGNRWSAVNRHPPLSTTGIYFRTVTTVDGYPVQYGAPTAAFAVVAGPELGLIVSAVSDSDTAGDSVHEGETLTYHCMVTNASGAEVSAAPAVLMVPVPLHTTFAGASSVNGPFTETKVRGVTTAVSWSFASLPKNTTFTEDLHVTVDTASKFSAAELKKYPNGFGYIVVARGSTLSAPLQGAKLIPAIYNQTLVFGHPEFDTEILGALKLQISSDRSGAAPGGLITYTLACENDSAQPLTGAIVIDEIPAGTELATVYAFDANGNAYTTPLPNPGPFTNPGIIYAKSKAITDNAKYLQNFPVAVQPLVALFLNTKAGLEFDVAKLNLAGLDQSTKDLLATSVNTLIDDGFLIPAKIKWNLGPVPGKGSGAVNVTTVGFTVRVPYDAPPGDIVNGHYLKPPIRPLTYLSDRSSYDFLSPGSNAPATAVSALYGAAPAPITVSVNNVTPAARPHLFLTKCARGDLSLNNPAFSANGYTANPIFGDIVNAVQGHGIDYQLTYRNDTDALGQGADAHGVVLHDVIPDGMLLRGFFTQNVNGQGSTAMHAGQFTFYDARGVIIPGIDPGTGLDNMALVRSMDIRLGDVSNLTVVPQGTNGYVEYTCEPDIAPTKIFTYGAYKFYITGGAVHSFGGFDPQQGPSSRLQGFYLKTSDDLAAVPGNPFDCIVQVKADVSWNFPAAGSALLVNDSQPNDVVPFDLYFSQNGDVAASNTVISFDVPQGATFLNGPFTPVAGATVTGNRTANNFQPFFTDDGTPVTSTQTGTKVQLSLNTVAGHTVGRAVRIFFAINGPSLDPAMAKSGFRFGPGNLRIAGSYQAPPVAAKALTRSTRSIPVATQSASATASRPLQMKVHELSPPKLGIHRDAPFLVADRGQFTYTIHFSNTGDSDATNVVIDMQVPFRTEFVSATFGTKGVWNPTDSSIVPVDNPLPYSTKPRTNLGVIHDSGRSIDVTTGKSVDIVTWHFDKLEQKSSGEVELVVRCFPGFADQPVQDHSLDIRSDQTGSIAIAANDVTTYIYGKDLGAARVQAALTFFSSQGVTITPELAPVVAAYAKTITTDTRVHSVAGLDALHLVSAGVKIIPLGKDQVLVISNDGGSIVSTGGGNLISQDGSTLVATGGGNAISIQNIPGTSSFSGTHTCAYLLDNIPAIVSAGGGNLVSAGGGNLIGNDGSSLISNHPGGGLLGPIGVAAASIVSAGGGNLVSAGGGNAVAVGASLVPNSALIGNDGSSVISNDGGSLTTYSSGIVSAGGGNLVSAGGGN